MVREVPECQVSFFSTKLWGTVLRVVVAVSLFTLPVTALAAWLSAENPFYLLFEAKVGSQPERKPALPGEKIPAPASPAPASLAEALEEPEGNPFNLFLGEKTKIFPAMKFDFRGETKPFFTSAAKASLSDDDIVIGVVAFGESKAYLREAFSGPGRHIVHDQYGAMQVTVTHCDRTRCTRVFSAAEDKDLKALHCGGWMEEQEMALLVEDQRYSQSSEEIPFDDVPFTITTWGEWRMEHPVSAVFDGQ